MLTHIDYMTPEGVQGPVANQIQRVGRLDAGRMRPFLHDDGRIYVTVYTGGDPKKQSSYKTMVSPRHELMAHATLRRDEWKQLDEAVQKIADFRLNGIADLISNGLVYSLGNAMGTTVLEHHSISDAMEAAVTMDGVTRSPGDRVTYKTHYLPIPIIHVDYEINARALEASRSMGNPLDTDNAERAARKVNEKLESMLFTSYTYAWGDADDDNRKAIYSYLSHPDRNTGSLTGAWTGLTGAQIITDVVAMKQASIDDRHYGPWMLYIPTAYETTLDKDYDTTTPGTTIRERILKIDNIKGVKVVDTLTAGNVLLVQMTPDVVRLVRGMGIQNVEWDTEGQFVTKYKVMTIQVPQIRSDHAGRSGVQHYSA